MHRFWVDISAVQGEKVFVKDSLFHHLCRVSRLKKGSPFTLVSQGFQCKAELVRVSKKYAEANIIEKKEYFERKKPLIRLLLSCPKFAVLENILRKLVELRADHLNLFTSDFSFIKNPSKMPQTRMRRWESIVKNSQAQSMNPLGLLIHPLLSLRSTLDFFSKTKNSKALFFYEGFREENLSKFLKLSSKTLSKLDEIWIFIGSEGGFSSREVQMFQSYEIRPISLGSSILKVETACLSVLSILQYTLGRL